MRHIVIPRTASEILKASGFPRAAASPEARHMDRNRVAETHERYHESGGDVFWDPVGGWFRAPRVLKNKPKGTS